MRWRWRQFPAPRRRASGVAPALQRGRVAAFAERLPVMVDLFLPAALHDERDRLVEAIQRSTVERRERLAVQLELQAEHAANRTTGLSRRGRIVAQHALDP